MAFSSRTARRPRRGLGPGFRPDHCQPLIWIRRSREFSARTKPALAPLCRTLAHSLPLHHATTHRATSLPWALSPAHAPTDGWTRRCQAAPWQSPTHARLHGAAAMVIHLLAVTTMPERAVVSGGSGSTHSGEQWHLTTHLLTEGANERRTDGSPSTQAVHGSSQAQARRHLSHGAPSTGGDHGEARARSRSCASRSIHPACGSTTAGGSGHGIFTQR
jgi:hypothetical protein